MEEPLAHKLIFAAIYVVSISLTGGFMANGAISISLQGTLSLTSDTNDLIVSLESLLKLGIETQAWQASAAITTQDNQLADLKIGDRFTVGPGDFEAEVGFAPQSAAFTYAQLRTDFPVDALRIASIVRLEKKGLGWGMDVHSSKSAAVQSVRL